MADQKPVIFLAFANDREDQSRYLRELGRELRSIRTALQPARRAGMVDVVERANASLSDIIDVFQDPEYAGRIAIFHFGGHAGSYQLLLESDDGTHRSVAHAEGLARFLSNQVGLKFVFLNGCSTEAQSARLLEAGIATTITTSEDINDATAHRFATRFYKGIGAYATISKAFHDAQAEVLTRQGSGSTRGLYWKPPETSEEDQQLPWRLAPETGSNFRLEPPEKPVEADSSALKVGEYAHVLVNRYEQDNEFISRYIETVKERRPKVFIIHGPREEKHESLITRFSYEYIGRKQYLRPLELGTWPFNGDGQTLLRLRLTEQFEGMSWAKEELQQISAHDLIHQPALKGKEAVILQHNLPGEYWRKETSDLLDWYIGKFWNISVDNLEAPHFVIFINVYYSQELEGGGFLSKVFSNKYFRPKIADELTRLARKNAANCTLLTELGKVRRPHLEDWLISTNLGEVSHFSGLPDSIFPSSGKGSAERAMAMVEMDVKRALDDYKQQLARKMM